MNKGWFRKVLPHGIAVVIFLLVAVIYCRPVLQGEVLQQSDVIQWKAMAKNSFDYKEKHGHFPLWTNSMFSGMPAYQIAMESKMVVSPGIFHTLLTLGLPKPISFFFLACICFYFLSQAFRLNPYIGIIGSLAYAYVTYNCGIIEAGHDTKMQAIAILPAFIGSLVLLYEGRFWWGTALTALFTALFIAMNHMQIVYYGLIIVFFMTIGYLVYYGRQKNYKPILVAIGLALAAGMVGIATNAVTILTTLEASKTTIRGGTELKDRTSSSTGLNKEYALNYSFYKAEPFVMMVPDVYGGSGTPVDEKLENSKALESLQAMPQDLANQVAPARMSYWGGFKDIPPNAPSYVGAVICFLALIGFFILDHKYKWWMGAACVLAILMTWGEYFEGFNVFLLNTLPGYNKFRVPSMTLIIPTFLFCVMAMLTLQKIITFDNRQELWDRYKKGLMLTAGVFLVLLIFYFTADFTSASDREMSKQISAAPDAVKEPVRNFLNALKDDRQSLFMSSLIRSFLFIAAAAAVIWFSVRKNIHKGILLGVVGLLAFIDIMAVDVKYLNSEKYFEESEVELNYTTPSPASQLILKDTGYYRVFDIGAGLTSAMPSYFHNSIVGYHPAKLSIYQDLIEHQISKFPQSMPVINMLNTKYLIQPDQSGTQQVYPNPEALGAAWFVKAVRYEKTAEAVMNALTGFHPQDTALVFETDRKLIQAASGSDTTGTIQLIQNDNDEVTYHSQSASNQFAVFSEVYYKEGWKAFIDDKESPIIRTNYVLRGLSVPAGQHTIRFVFHPDAYYNGQTIAQIASIIIFLMLIAAAVQTYRVRKAKKVHA